MSTTATSEWKHPMVVTEESLAKIEALIKRKVAKPDITATCADNTEHKFSSVNTLAKYENAAGSRIQSVRFWAVKDGDWSKQARVWISSGGFRTLDIEVKGTQATAPSVRDELEKICEGVRAWYWPIYKVDFVMLLFGAFFLLWFAANVWVRIERGTMVLKDTNSDDAVGLIVAVAIIAIGSTIHFLRGRLFPQLTVLVGQEIGRHKTLEKVQWAVVIGFFVSVIAGIAVAVIT